MQNDSDQQLVKRLLDGDDSAMDALVTRYHGRLVRLARNFVKTREAAEDAAQETWMAMFRGLENFRGEGTFRSWLFRILVNQARNHGVRENRFLSFSSFDDGVHDVETAVEAHRFNTAGHWSEPPELWDRDTPEKLLGSAETIRTIEEALVNLPDLQRIVFLMRDVEQLDHEEVCNALGITETNQRVLLHRARSRIRQLIEQVIGRKPVC